MADDAVVCPYCEKRYRWSAELAGKKARCLCGAVLRFPEMAGQGFELIQAAPLPRTMIPPGPLEYTNPPEPSEPPESLKPAQRPGPPAEIPAAAAPPAPRAATPPPLPRAAPFSLELASVPPPLPAKPAVIGYELQFEGADATSEADGSGGQPGPVGLSAPTRCPNCGTMVGAGAVLCLNCGFHMTEGRRLETVVQETDAGSGAGDPAGVDLEESATAGAADSTARRRSPVAAALTAGHADKQRRIIDFYLPIALVLTGFGVAVVEARYFAPSQGSGVHMAMAIGGVTILMLAMVPLLLLACFIASAILDVNFGPLWTGLLKLEAIAIGPGAIGQILSDLIQSQSPGWSGMATGAMASYAVSGIVYWTLLTLFFELTVAETLYTMLIIMVVNYAGLLLAAVVLARLFL